MSTLVHSPIHPVYFAEHIEDSLGPMSFAAGVRVITWDLATYYQNGAYNGTFAFGNIQHSLNLLSRYWNIAFQRVTRGGQYHVIQANYNLGNNVAARSGGNTTVISPNFRFSTVAQCEMVIHHEYNHITDLAHNGDPNSIMSPNGGYFITPGTYKWYRNFQWKGALRPEHEPNFMRQYWLGAVTLDQPENMHYVESHEYIPPYKCGNHM